MLSKLANASCQSIILLTSRNRILWSLAEMSPALQQCGQTCGTSARSCDLSSEPVMQSHAIQPVAVTGDLFDGAKVHYGVSANLDEWISA
jgi:hypothetical protein